MRVKLRKTIAIYFLALLIELNEVEASTKKPASLILYVITSVNDVQKQEKKQ